MTILEYAPDGDEILDFIHQAIRQLHDADLEAKYILVGSAAYETLRHAISERFNRPEGRFETYQYLPIVLDPSRTDTVAVLPAPMACRDARVVRVD